MKMIINGEKLDASDGKVIEVLNPATGELVGTVPAATQEDVEKCLQAAYDGKKTWGRTDAFQRKTIIDNFAKILPKYASEIGELCCRELGKPIGSSTFEVILLAKIAHGYAEAAAHLHGTAFSDACEYYAKDHVFTVREPLGVVCCIIPFNFPLYIFAHKVIPALLMGNTVIVKPASSNPLTLVRVVEVLHEAGVPKEALHIVTGSGETVGNQLVDSEKINAVAFTGSTKAGAEIAERAAKHMHHVMLECGGNDPFIVYDDADIGLAVNEAAAGRLANAGQVCCSPKRFLVQRGIHDEFVSMLKEKLEAVKYGDPMDPKTALGCMVDEKSARKVEDQVALTVSQGAKLLCGGKRDGVFWQPALLDGVTLDMDVATDMEIFGAVFSVITFDTEDEALEIANASKYGLSGAVFTKDMQKALRTARGIQSGSIVINGNESNNRLAEEPFGGYKMSGYGREGIYSTLEEMSQVKTIVMKNMW